VWEATSRNHQVTSAVPQPDLEELWIRGPTRRSDEQRIDLVSTSLFQGRGALVEHVTTMPCGAAIVTSEFDG